MIQRNQALKQLRNMFLKKRLKSLIIQRNEVSRFHKKKLIKLEKSFLGVMRKTIKILLIPMKT